MNYIIIQITRYIPELAVLEFVFKDLEELPSMLQPNEFCLPYNWHSPLSREDTIRQHFDTAFSWIKELKDELGQITAHQYDRRMNRQVAHAMALFF